MDGWMALSPDEAGLMVVFSAEAGLERHSLHAICAVWQTLEMDEMWPASFSFFWMTPTVFSSYRLTLDHSSTISQFIPPHLNQKP